MARLSNVARSAAAAAAVALAVTTPAAASASVATDPCRALTHFNVFALRNVHLARSEVTGPLAVGGNAILRSFSVNAATPCTAAGDTVPDLALAVGGVLHADRGQINAGAVAVSGHYYGSPSVGLRCARHVSGAFDFQGLAAEAVANHAALCATPVANCKTAIGADGGVTFAVTGEGDIATCAVAVGDLNSASRVAITGRSAEQEVVLKVFGGHHWSTKTLTLTNVAFHGFVSERTVLSACDRVHMVVIKDVGLSSAVSAPHTDLVGPSGHIRGTVIVRSVRGGMEFRHAPVACDAAAADEVPSPSPAVEW